jgi:hypothetical protein
VKVTDIFKTSDSTTDDSLDTLEVLRELSTIVSLSANLTDNKRLARVVTGISVATSLSTVCRHFYAAYKKRGASNQFVIKISETDPVFVIAERWLSEALSEHQKKSVFLKSSTSASSNYTGSGEAVPESSVPQPTDVKLSLHLDGTTTQDVVIAGYTVKISSTNVTGHDEKKKKDLYTSNSIVLTCPSLAARDAVVKQLEVEAQKLVNQKPTFHTTTSWGSFRHVSVIPHRPIDSVILKDGQMERILTFMRRFLDNEEAYVKLGIPYRTGMLLYGNPGSGKSSTATAIANELGLNIYYVSLSGLDGDDSLARAFGEIPAYSLAILEDVDVYNAVKDRKDKDTGEPNGVTLAGILNTLDGLNSPHGVITVMTTNHRENIDPAILRPGRVDLSEELNELDSDQLRRMCEYFIGYVPDGLPEITPNDMLTSSQIVEVIRKHIPFVENAGNDIVDFVSSKVLSFTK